MKYIFCHLNNGGKAILKFKTSTTLTENIILLRGRKLISTLLNAYDVYVHVCINYI